MPAASPTAAGEVKRFRGAFRASLPVEEAQAVLLAVMPEEAVPVAVAVGDTTVRGVVKGKSRKLTEGGRKDG
jgi:hypothetical protein